MATTKEYKKGDRVYYRQSGDWLPGIYEEFGSVYGTHNKAHKVRKVLSTGEIGKKYHEAFGGIKPRSELAKGEKA